MRMPSKAQIEQMGINLEDMTAETEGLGPPDPEMLGDCGDGEVRPILVYPNPRLRDGAAPVIDFDDRVRKLVADLATTMYTVNGIGLAATQIGEADQVFVVDILNGQPPQKGRPSNQLLVAVNPKIWAIPGKVKRDAERCLSFPDAVELVTRPTSIILKAYTHRGKPYAMGCSGDLARAVQHEFDHLEGKLLIDHMSKKRVRDLKRHAASRVRR